MVNVMLGAIFESLIYVALFPWFVLRFFGVFSILVILLSMLLGTLLTFVLLKYLEKPESMKFIAARVITVHLIMLSLIFVNIILCLYLIRRHFKLSKAETLTILFSSYLIPFVFSASIVISIV